MTFPLLTLDQAVEALSQGKPVVLPTDTVYGVGVAVRAAASPQMLFEAKDRPDSKPVAWLVADAEALDEYGADVPAYARELVQNFWPGALTLVVRASDAVPPAFQSADGTIGLRMPASPEALELIRAAGSPLAVTSANLSGEPAPSTLDDLDPALMAATAGVLASSCPHVTASSAASPTTLEAAAAGPVPVPAAVAFPAAAPEPMAVPPAVELASTVLDCTGSAPRVLRQGALPLKNLLEGLSGDGKSE